MQFTIVLNQPFMLAHGLSVNAGVMLSIITSAATWAENTEPGWYWIAQKKVMAEAPAFLGSAATVKRAARELEDAGLIERQVASNKYLIRLTDEGKGWSRKQSIADSEVRSKLTGPVKSDHTGAVKTDRRGAVKSAPQSIYQGSDNQDQEQKPCATKVALCEFDRWWKHYPRKEAKKKSKEVWKRKKLDSMTDQLIADVERRKIEHRPWLEGFVPHAERYLRDERWDDEIDKSAAPKTNGRKDSYDDWADKNLGVVL